MIKKTCKYFGTTIEKSIEETANELGDDRIGLWQIIGSGYDNFDLRENELCDFVRQHIIVIINRGGIPVRASEGYPAHWIKQTQYGTNAIEIANNIVLEIENSVLDFGDCGPEIGLGINFILPRDLDDVLLKPSMLPIESV